MTASKMVTIDPTEPVSFRVEVGNGMPGGTAWHFVDESGKITTEEVTLSGDLQFNTLFCTTTVEDNNPLTNRTAVTYHIRNGGSERSFPFTFTLPDKSRFVSYILDFTFI
ncbi:MAG TPA: hypothetical protein VFS20_21515 [Longimicrobium sp.]|nr:hypothetical protein [Longimicrobium sp.]